MLGAFSLLPLLKGWEYIDVPLPVRTLINGASPTEVYRVGEEGWLLATTMLSTDCYATARLTYQGADLQTRTLTFSAEGGRVSGAWQQDPAGWVQRYYRPLQASTAGIYMTVLTSSGFQGNPLPYYRTVIVDQYLPTTSTETACLAAISINKIAITDKTAFILSLRKLLGVKTTKIHPALLTIGPASFEEEE